MFAMAAAFLGGFSKSHGVQRASAPVPIEETKARRFKELVLPHLDSAYNLARWLTRSDADAQDVVQEACLRAFKYFDGFDGQYANAWLLKIVRNTCFSWIKANRPAAEAMAWEDKAEEVEADAASIALNAVGLGRSPEAALAEKQEARRLNRLLAELPPPYREVLILREMEDLSYREIADIVGVPIGTVMSRLARGRQSLQAAWHRSEQGSRP
jgi:RNA polymerase sigma-70 factor (ECF subfamily)